MTTPGSAATPTSCAAPTSCATSPTPPRPTPASPGPPRSPRRCRHSSTPRTRPATPASPPSPPRRPPPLTAAYRDAITAGLAHLEQLGGPKRKYRQGLLEVLRDREHDILRFLTDTRIPATSNQAERDPAPRQNPGQDLRPPPIRANSPAPLRHPRLPLHRRQAPGRHPHRPPRRHHRQPMDATHPRHPLTTTTRETPRTPGDVNVYT